jgi:hypothetical protein
MRVWSHDSHIEWHCANAVQAAHRALTDRSEKCMRPHVVALIAALAFSALQARAQQADCGVPAKLTTVGQSQSLNKGATSARSAWPRTSAST